jgi:hypothetical protein
MSKLVVASLPWPFDEGGPNPEIAERQAIVARRRFRSEVGLARERWRQTFRRRKCRPFVATLANAEEYAEHKFTQVHRVLDVAHLDPGSQHIIRFLAPIAHDDKRPEASWNVQEIFLDLETRWAAGDAHVVRDEFPLRRPA